MYRYFQGADDAEVYWRLNTQTGVVQHVVADWDDKWANPMESVIHTLSELEVGMFRGELIEIDYNPIGTDDSEHNPVPPGS